MKGNVLLIKYDFYSFLLCDNFKFLFFEDISGLKPSLTTLQKDLHRTSRYLVITSLAKARLCGSSAGDICCKTCWFRVGKRVVKETTRRTSAVKNLIKFCCWGRVFGFATFTWKTDSAFATIWYTLCDGMTSPFFVRLLNSLNMFLRLALVDGTIEFWLFLFFWFNTQPRTNPTSLVVMTALLICRWGRPHTSTTLEQHTQQCMPKFSTWNPSLMKNGCPRPWGVPSYFHL